MKKRRAGERQSNRDLSLGASFRLSNTRVNSSTTYTSYLTYPRLQQAEHSAQTRYKNLKAVTHESCQRFNKGFAENMWLVSFHFSPSSTFDVKHDARDSRRRSTQLFQFFNFHTLSKFSASWIQGYVVTTSLSLSMVFQCGSSTPHSLEHRMSPNIHW